MTTTPPADLRAIIGALFVDKGWTLSDGPALASKEFETAVGPKGAIAWLYPSRGNAGDHTLAGEFWSEGRNVCAPCMQIGRLAQAFITSVEAAVSDSYAVRLHHHSTSAEPSLG